MSEGGQSGAGPIFEGHILTLFPDFFTSPLSASILGRALARGEVRVQAHDIRAFASGKHRVTDDTPYGGGAGMVMKAGPIVRCLEAVEEGCLERGGARPHRIVLTPGGARFDQRAARRLASLPAISVVCGRYEGIDERVMAHVDEEISVGDFVLTGGEPAALAVLDAVIRLLPGVLGNAASAEDESFGQGLLEYPQFTRPAIFREVAVPEILLSGDHARVDRWRRGQALLRTSLRRPELLADLELTKDDRRLLEQARQEAIERSGTPAPAQEDP